MTFDEYQAFAKEDWKPGCDEITFALGLGGETGEVLDIIKKARRDCVQVDTTHLAEEIGDVLWYVANLCTAYGFRLEEIAMQNRDKLMLRYGKALCYRRNGPHIEQVDPSTGKHIRFVSRTQFTQEELKLIDDAYKQRLQDARTAHKTKAIVEDKVYDDSECPFD